MRVLLQQTWRYLPAQIVAPAVQLVALLVWAHLLPLDEVGRLTLVVATQEVLFAALFMGWSHFMLRHLPRYEAGDAAKRFCQTEAWALGSAMTVQCVLLALLLPLIFGPELPVAFVLSAVAFAVVRSVSVYLGEKARARGDAAFYTFLNAYAPACGLLVAIGVIVAGGDSAASVLASIAGVQACAVIVALSRNGISATYALPDREIMRAVLVFGLPLAASGLLAAGSLNAPRFLVEQSLGLSAAGLFGIVYGLGMRACGVAVMLVTVAAYPLAIRTMEAEGTAAAHRQLATNIVLVALALFPAGLGLVAISASLVQTLLPADLHQQAATLLPLAVCCGMVRALRAHTTDQVFVLHARSGTLAAIASVELVLLLGLSSAGLSRFGLAGALWGVLSAFIVSCCLSFAIARFRFGFRYPVLHVGRVAAAAGVMLLALSGLPQTGDLFALALIVLLGGVVYAGCLALLFPRLAARLLRARLLRAVGA